MKLLHQLFEQQARKTPDRDALAFEGRTLSYAELDRRADLVAGQLQEMGIGPDALVALFMPRSLEMIVGVLGILKSGGAYVPIDAAHPPARVAFVLDDARVRAVLTTSTLLERLPEARPSAICLDGFDWTQPRSRIREAAVDPSHLAYVIYTSGSSGQPKGVCIEHRNIVNYVLGVSARFEFGVGLRHATVSTIAADLGNTVIFPALSTGGCLHVIAEERAESQARLSEYFSREAIDVLKIVPSHLAALQTGDHPELVMPRRRLILGGEASRPAWVQQLRALRPDCEIHNHYGPTETTVGVLTYRVGSDASPHAATVPLGRPLPGGHVYVLDSNGSIVPPGEEGELCVGGAGVARGYLNRPELTAEKFIADPFVDNPHARLYRTGDLARYLPDGNIEFLGRMDDQIKLHGNRIEPAEIESALRAIPGIRDALVLPRDDASSGRRLIAYVVPMRIDQPLWDKTSTHLLPDGTTVAHLNRNETEYIYDEIFVRQAYLRHGVTVHDGDCIVDAGANIGLFTVFASRLAKNLKIVAFEPNPSAFDCLLANAAACDADVTCLPIGLSRENRLAELTSFAGLSLLSGLYADAAIEREVVKTYVDNQRGEPHDDRVSAEIGELIDDRLRSTTVDVELRTLSRVIAEQHIDRIDLLKVNVEKSELDVLLGLSDADWSRIRQLVIEIDTRENLQPVEDLLKHHGFEVVIEQDELLRRTDLCYVYASRQPAARAVSDRPANAHIRQASPPDTDVLTPHRLRAGLKERLPQYMIPSAFVLLERLPLTPNGKIDRHALAGASTERPVAIARGFEPPRSETEKALAAIWSEMLDVENVGVADDFFDLGGQSLTAIRTVSRIRDAFAVDLSLRNVFEQPTLGGLAEIIDRLRWVSTAHTATTSGDREEIAL